MTGFLDAGLDLLSGFRMFDRALRGMGGLLVVAALVHFGLHVEVIVRVLVQAALALLAAPGGIPGDL